MSQALLDNQYAWLSEKNCRDAKTALHIEYSRDHFLSQATQYILVVDLKYPRLLA